VKEEETFLDQLLKKNDTIVFACSGGPDSMCLLNLLWQQKEKKELTLICAHINHNLREESKQEYAFVKKYCEDHQIIFEGTKFNNYPSKNFHATAHQMRKEYFETLITKYQANYLMTAHHGDDLVETILMRLTRGSSLKGYAGFMKVEEKDHYQIIRPLITATKEQIKSYNDQNHIPYVLDPSNESDKYTRNRYRHYVLPILKKEQPNVHRKFIEFQEELCRINEFLVKFTTTALTDCIENDTLLIVEFLGLDPLIQRKVIQEYLYHVYKKDIILLSEKHINQILHLLNSSKSNGEISLPRNRVGRKSYNLFRIEERKKENSYQILLENEVDLMDGKIEKTEYSDIKSNNIIRLSSQEIKLPLYVRNRQNGDKIAVKNLQGHQKVKDIFIDKKISKEKRMKWPIVVDSNNTILWIPGLKKSKFDKEINEKYDIIYKYVLSKEKKYVTKK